MIIFCFVSGIIKIFGEFVLTPVNNYPLHGTRERHRITGRNLLGDCSARCKIFPRYSWDINFAVSSHHSVLLPALWAYVTRVPVSSCLFLFYTVSERGKRDHESESNGRLTTARSTEMGSKGSGPSVLSNRMTSNINEVAAVRSRAIYNRSRVLLWSVAPSDILYGTLDTRNTLISVSR